MKHIRYLSYVLRHKWFVFIELFHVWQNNPLDVILLWRGFIHDMSKFSPAEWGPYVDYFYGDNHNKTQSAFDNAWNHHQNRNSHHWQYWLLQEDDGELKVLEMPDLDRMEMICDWKGAGRATGHPDTSAWYQENYHKIQLAPHTRALVNFWLAVFEGE